MNNIFNINRFGLLIKRQWLDFGKIYLISLVVITGVLIGFYAWQSPSPLKGLNYDNDGNLDLRFRYPLFLIVGFLFISIVASSYFATMGQKSRAILELMIPASTFEKFLTALFYTSVISLLSFLILFYFTDLAFVKYINAHLTEFKVNGNHSKSLKPVESIATQITNDENYRNFILNQFPLPLLVTSIFLLGSIYFNRFHYIKTAVSVIVFCGLASYICIKVAELLTRDMIMKNQSYNNDKSDVLLFLLLISITLTLIFWTITYVRLKEKEV